MKRVRIDYRHFICAAVLVGFLMLSVFVYTPVFGRSLEAGRDIGTSIAYYFCVMFFLKTPTPTVTLPPKVEMPVIIPDTWDGVAAKSGLYWQSFLNGETYGNYFLGLGKSTALFFQILLILIPLLLLIIHLLKRMLRNPNNDYARDSRPLKAWKGYTRRVYTPVRDWLKDMVLFVRDTGHGVYWKIGLAVWLYNLNVFTIVLELIAFVFYFFVSFDFLSLFTQIYKLAYDLTLTANALPWYVWIVVLLILFQRWRHRMGVRVQQRHEANNVRTLNNLPVASLIVGSMGAGKTTHMVDAVLSYESMWREKAFEIMSKYDLMFPEFPWINFENSLQEQLAAHAVYNLATIRQWAGALRLNYDTLPCRETCFGYDVKNLPFVYNDRLRIYDIFDALEIYAQAYFIYICQSSLIISNLGIRTDGFCKCQGNLPMWNYDFFSRDPWNQEQTSRHSHILNWDTLRLGRKFTSDRKNNFLEFGIFSITEIFKDRGNQHETEGVKRQSDKTNQKNDRFNWVLKTCRHAATVDNYPFFKLVCDDQREDSGPADLVQLMTVVTIGRAKSRHLAFPFFSLEGLLIDLYLSWFARLYREYRYSRGDNTLLMHGLHMTAAKLGGYLNGIEHMYGYSRSELILSDGKTAEDILTLRYYLADKKIYSRRFDTACYRDFFVRRVLSAGIGLDDIPEYETETASLEELRGQESYMLREIDTLTDPKEERAQGQPLSRKTLSRGHAAGGDFAGREIQPQSPLTRGDGD